MVETVVRHFSSSENIEILDFMILDDLVITS